MGWPPGRMAVPGRPEAGQPAVPHQRPGPGPGDRPRHCSALAAHDRSGWVARQLVDRVSWVSMARAPSRSARAAAASLAPGHSRRRPPRPWPRAWEASVRASAHRARVAQNRSAGRHRLPAPPGGVLAGGQQRGGPRGLLARVDVGEGAVARVEVVESVGQSALFCGE